MVAADVLLHLQAHDWQLLHLGSLTASVSNLQKPICGALHLGQDRLLLEEVLLQEGGQPDRKRKAIFRS